MIISRSISSFIEKSSLRRSGTLTEESELNKIDTLYYENSENINHSVIL